MPCKPECKAPRLDPDEGETFDPHAGLPCIGAGCRVCLSLSDELPRPTPSDLERWRQSAHDVPGPLGRAFLILLAEVELLGAEREAARALLRRVRCYAVVDTLGNPKIVPSVARMFGIESDIDNILDLAARG